MEIKFKEISSNYWQVYINDVVVANRDGKNINMFVNVRRLLAKLRKENEREILADVMRRINQIIDTLLYTEDLTELDARHFRGVDKLTIEPLVTLETLAERIKAGEDTEEVLVAHREVVDEFYKYRDYHYDD